MTRQQKCLAIGGGALLVAVVLVVVVLLSSGGDNTISAGQGTTTSSSTVTTTTLAPTTLPPATTAATTPVTVGGICNVPDDAAKALVNSWIAGNQAAARRCATSGAVATLFQNSGAGAQWTFQGCNGSNDPGVPVCQYSYEGGAANLTLNGTENQGWKVVSVGYIAD